jgi:NADPH-dependent 2,4-dienoyl-CoA reductase/sulfur reductase-like enzyme
MLQDAKMYPEMYNYKVEFVSYLIKRAAQEDYQRIAIAKFNEEQKHGDPKKYEIPNIIRPALEKKKQNVDPGNIKFCIVGAGVAGLYTALILEKLGIDYEILEASDRIGGRIYTHHFTEDKHDYYDIGAMRFPDNPIMKR